MGTLDNINTYLKNKGKYSTWLNEREEKEQKRLSYLKKNPVSDSEKDVYVKKAHNILNAIDIMDEYSQSRAEDAELALTSVQGGLAHLSGYLGMGLAGLYIFLTKSTGILDEVLTNKNYKNIKKLVPAAILFVLPALGLQCAYSFWGAKKEVQASRIGRLEAMENTLSSENYFAQLTPEQEKQVKEEADKINVTKKDKKKFVNANGANGLLKSIKSVLSSNKEQEERIKQFNEKLKESYNSLKDVQLTLQEELDAKKDQQMIQNIVHKIDIASQDYAENVELATDTIMGFALGSGGFLTLLTSKLLKKINVTNKYVKIATLGLSFAPAVICALLSTKLQKQASRVGRFKVKQKLLSNPESLIYVDDKKAENEQVETVKKEKENIFKNIKNILKDNFEYSKYIKENGNKHVQKLKAIENIKLTDGQKVKAKNLQQNVFKMFNTLDEKSQSMSESVEATGELINSIVQLASMIPITYFAGKSVFANKVNAKSVLGIIFATIPTILANIFITKQQRKASRVASMLAINEMSDYKQFANRNKSDIVNTKNYTEKKLNTNQINEFMSKTKNAT